MNDEQESKEVRQTVRFPRDMHEAIVRLAAGDAQHPPSSFNKTLIFVVQAGLEAIARQRRSKT